MKHIKQKRLQKRSHKRSFWISLLALLFFSSIQPDAAYAASPALSASADAASAEEGSFVNISISLSGNPSFSTLGMALSYDSSILKYDSTSWSGGFSDGDMKMASDTGSEVNLSVVCEDSYAADGTVASVRFQAVQDASSIPVTLSLRDMADADLEPVSDSSVDGNVQTPAPESGGENSGNNTNNMNDADNEADMAGTGGGDDTEGRTQDSQEQEEGQNQVTGTVSAGTNQAQRTSAQDVQAVSVSDAESSKTDASYQTGAGMGNDIFLIAAAACGAAALLLVLKKAKGKDR